MPTVPKPSQAKAAIAKRAYRARKKSKSGHLPANNRNVETPAMPPSAVTFTGQGMSVPEASKELSITELRVARLCNDGLLVPQRSGRKVVAVSAESVGAYKASRGQHNHRHAKA